MKNLNWFLKLVEKNKKNEIENLLREYTKEVYYYEDKDDELEPPIEEGNKLVLARTYIPVYLNRNGYETITVSLSDDGKYLLLLYTILNSNYLPIYTIIAFQK